MFIEGAAIAIIYFIVKFLEMRFVTCETLPLKVIIRDTTVVYLASIIGLYTLSQFKLSDLIKGGSSAGGLAVGSTGDGPIVGAFTAAPDF